MQGISSSCGKDVHHENEIRSGIRRDGAAGFAALARPEKLPLRLSIRRRNLRARAGIANLFMLLGFTLRDARTFVSVSLIFLSAALTAFGVYDNIAKHAGAGTLVPITGFANSMVSPALEFKSEGFVTGLGAKMFVVSGPVLVFGISASVFYGVVLYVIGLFQG